MRVRDRRYILSTEAITGLCVPEDLGVEGGLGNDSMCFQSKENRCEACRIRSVCLQAQAVGQVLHWGRRTLPFLEDKESISNNMVGMKSVLTLDNKETWVWCLLRGRHLLVE